MPTANGKLGVGICGVGWCGAQHIQAFQKNPHTEVTWLYGGPDEQRTRASAAKNNVDLPDARIARSYEEFIAAPDVDIVSIASPNHLHADQAVAAAERRQAHPARKADRPDVPELNRIRDAVRRAGVRTIVSFELRYNPLIKFAHWLRESGTLGTIRFARVQYLSRVTDWYSGWNWVRTIEGGGSHLLAAGCHAVDALRWCSGREAVSRQRAADAFHRGLRVADVDTRQHRHGGRRARPRHELDRLHDALQLPHRADGRQGDASPGPAAVGEDAARPRRAARRQSVPRGAARGRDRLLRPARHLRAVPDTRTPPTSATIRSRRRSTTSSTASSPAGKRCSTSSTRRRRWRSVSRRINRQRKAGCRWRCRSSTDVSTPNVQLPTTKALPKRTGSSQPPKVNSA